MTDCTCQPYWPGDDARHLCTCGGRRHRLTYEGRDADGSFLIKAEAMDRALATEEFVPARKCLRCDGRGWVSVAVGYDWRNEKCPDCKGSGARVNGEVADRPGDAG